MEKGGREKRVEDSRTQIGKFPAAQNEVIYSKRVPMTQVVKYICHLASHHSQDRE